MIRRRTDRPKVVVVGAGLAGLAAGAVLRRRGVDVTVLEREDWIGGRAKTVRLAGTPVDLGAQFIATFATGTLGAATAAGLGDELVPVRERTAVVRDGVAWDIGRASELLRGGLLSPQARIRIGGLMAPMLAAWRRLDGVDLSRAWELDRRSALDLMRRWTGDETATNFVGPLLRGLLYWDLATTSQSVLLAMIKVGLGDGTVIRVRGGMGRLVDVLAEDMDVRTGSVVTSVALEHEERCRVAVQRDDQHFELVVDGVVCATTATAAATLLVDPPAATAAFLKAVSYSRTRVATYRVEDAEAAPASSWLFPTDAVSQLASVNPAFAGPHDVGRYVKVHLSDRGAREFDGLGDDEFAARALDLVRDASQDRRWTDCAAHVHALRWDEALPRFPAGYLRAAALRNPASLDVGCIIFAGDYLLAPHVEGAVRSGQAAGARMLRHLARR